MQDAWREHVTSVTMMCLQVSSLEKVVRDSCTDSPHVSLRQSSERESVLSGVNGVRQGRTGGHFPTNLLLTTNKRVGQDFLKPL